MDQPADRANPGKTAPDRRPSFTMRAAWYSVTIPLITPFVWFLVAELSGGYLIMASTVASCLLGSSLLAGVASLIRGHEQKRYIFIAVIGIVLSGALGFFSLMFRNLPTC